MAVYEDTIYARFVAQIEGLDKWSFMGKRLAGLEQAGFKTDRIMQGLQTTLEDTSALDVLNNSFEQTTNQVREMSRLGPMFSFLFGGMALQRMGMQITKFLIPAMDKLNQLQSDGAKQVGRLNASFQFLKISMFETLSNTPMFRNFIEFLITANDKFSEFTQKHPVLVQMLGVVGGIATVLGTLAIGVGLFNQFAMMAGYLGVNGSLAKGAADTSTALGKITSGLTKTLGVGLIAKGFWEGFQYLGEEGDVWDLINAAMFVGIGAAFLGAGVWSIPIAGVVALTLTLGKVMKYAPKKITMEEYGLSQDDWAELMSIGEDSNLQKAYFEGFQGTVVPSYVEDSWNDLASTVDLSAATSARAINTNLVEGSLPMLDQSFINTGNTAQANIIDKWDNWVPREKTLVVNVRRNGTSTNIFSSGLDSTVGSITGG